MRRARIHSSNETSHQQVQKGMSLRDAERSRITYLLAVAVIAVAIFAYTSVGPASSQSAAVTRTATAQYGVVQSTVSGSGTVEPADELNLGFKTAGTVSHIYVSAGEHVSKGQLLAELDPKNAEVTLDQARASLQSAEATLAQEEDSEGETATGGSAAPAGGSSSAARAAAGGAQAPTSQTSTTRTRQSAATREATLASARAAVNSDKLAVESDEQAVQSTKLYAPESGTIITLSGEVGETVSASGTTKGATAASSSATGGSAAGAGAGRGGAGSGAGASGSSSSSSGSSGAAFAVLGKLGSMRLVVGLSESEIGQVKVGQTATVTIEALSGSKLAAHVIEVATLPTSSSSSGVVTYDVTFALDQLEAGLKPGMSATAEVVVSQEEGVSIPSSAITGDSVTVIEAGAQVRRSVVTGLAGNSQTLIRSGLNAGERVLLPAITSTGTGTSGSSGVLSRLRSRIGGALGGGGLLGGGPAGG